MYNLYCLLPIASRGPHLLPIALKYSTLANELRILFHNLVGIALVGSCIHVYLIVCFENIVYRGALGVYCSEWTEGDEYPAGLQGGETMLRQHVHNED